MYHDHRESGKAPSLYSHSLLLYQDSETVGLRQDLGTCMFQRAAGIMMSAGPGSHLRNIDLDCQNSKGPVKSQGLNLYLIVQRETEVQIEQ